MRKTQVVGPILIIAAMVAAYLTAGAFPSSARWIVFTGILVAVMGMLAVAARRASQGRR